MNQDLEKETFEKNKEKENRREKGKGDGWIEWCSMRLVPRLRDRTDEEEEAGQVQSTSVEEVRT